MSPFPEASPPPGLHATYLPDPRGGRLFLWGGEAASRRSCARVLDRPGGSDVEAHLEEATARLLLPVADGDGEGAERSDGDTVAPFRVRGWALSPLAAALILCRLGRSTGGGAEAPGASLRCWSLAARLALELVARGRIAPRWLPADDDGAEAVWVVAPGPEGDRRRLETLATALPPAGRAGWVDAAGAEDGAGGGDAAPDAGHGAWPAGALLRRFADDVADAVVRAAVSGLDLEVLSDPLVGAADWQWKWLGALYRARDEARFHVEDAKSHLLRELERWVEPLLDGGEVESRGCLVLRAPDREDDAWTAELAVQARDDPSLRVSARRVYEEGRTVLEVEGRTFRRPRSRLRRAGRAAADVHPAFQPLSRAPDEGVALSTAEVSELLDRGVPALRRAGLGVVLPDSVTEAPAPVPRLRLDADAEASVTGGATEPGAAVGSRLDLDALLDFSWEVSLGDDALSAEEFRELVEGGRVLVRRREGWIFLGGGAVAEAERRMARSLPARAGAAAKLAAGLAGSVEVDDGGAVPVVTTPAVERVVSALREGGPTTGDRAAGENGATGRAPEAVDPVGPPGFRGRLRPYQVRGVRWMAVLGRYGLGGILADEMGLGKTIQLIALVLASRAGEGGERPSVVVCPASVLGNWQHELAHFAPDLPVHRHHGPERPDTPERLREAAGGGVVVTTYGILHRDADLLAAVRWRVAALDEAQNIKNPDTGRAGAARRLQAAQRLALTGTPVENRLRELWSISEFVNPGLLGPRSRFEGRFARPIEDDGDADATRRLRRITAPFVLRRLKAEVAPELPKRVEMNVYCTLSGEQASLYEAVLEESLAELQEAEGMKRRGRVLALLTRLKQVVNHPAHYLAEEGPLPGRSGKLDRLTEMLLEIVDDGERALVFTQYRKMGDLLVAHLRRLFGEEVPFLHGGVPPDRRDRQVREFQAPDGPSAFVLSLRAGGTGLNLTGANHVIHYDRWWNPAVEDQATDRAHRIGQRDDVFVHRFVALGTLEERIAALLERKRALADAVIPTGESWITELADDELRELVSLDRSAVLDPDDAEADGLEGGPADPAAA